MFILLTSNAYAQNSSEIEYIETPTLTSTGAIVEVVFNAGDTLPITVEYSAVDTLTKSVVTGSVLDSDQQDFLFPITGLTPASPYSLSITPHNQHGPGYNWTALFETLNTTAIETVVDSHSKIYAKGHTLYISTDLAGKKLQVFDMLGNQVFDNLHAGDVNQLPAGLASGVYIATITTDFSFTDRLSWKVMIN